MNYLFSIQEFANLSIENKRLKEQVEYHREFEKNQAEYIQALKGKIEALEKSNRVQQKLIEEYRDHALLLKRLIAEEKCSCSEEHECSCNKPLLTKEVFVEIINLIKKGYERRNKLSDALEEVNEGWFICNLGEEWINALINLLCIVMKDKPGDDDEETIIEWWLYSDSVKQLAIIEEESKTLVDLQTPEQLYDYLTSNN
jgi:hypothetical protein